MTDEEVVLSWGVGGHRLRPNYLGTLQDLSRHPALVCFSLVDQPLLFFRCYPSLLSTLSGLAGSLIGKFLAFLFALARMTFFIGMKPLRLVCYLARQIG